MNIDSLFAVICTADIDAADTFYTALFGRNADDRPMDGLIQWRDVRGAGVQIVHDADKAGSSLLTIVVPDMGTARRDLAGRGLELGDGIDGDFAIVAQIDDPDHNRITLTEPPQSMTS